MELRKIGLGVMNWIEQAQDREEWRAVVNTVMNIWVLCIRFWNILEQLSNWRLLKKDSLPWS
jgi:hypothetical protein